MSGDNNINLTPVCQRMPVYFTYSLNSDPLRQRFVSFEYTDNIIKRQRFYENNSLGTEQDAGKNLHTGKRIGTLNRNYRLETPPMNALFLPCLLITAKETRRDESPPY
ncbi:MAG: hypothetical protein D3922_10085 [Candidatus Electrothrix sp. AR1]|nr:hypothetical protein [Candidatus Electrothrix sp. AR1]